MLWVTRLLAAERNAAADQVDSSDITGLYTARYGVPPVAKKVYIQVNQFVDGWESRPVSFWAIVPATA